MKNTYCFFICLFLYFSISAQENDWNIRLSFYHQNELNKEGEDLIAFFDEINFSAVLGFGLCLNKKLIKNKRFSLQGGIGYLREVVLPRILVRTCVEGEVCSRVGSLKDNYSVDMLTLPIINHINIYKGLGVDLEILSQFRFHQNTSKNLTSKFLFAFEGFSIYPGVTYRISRIKLGVGYRLINFRKRDKVYDIGIDNLLRYPNYYKNSFGSRNLTRISVFIEYGI